MRFSRQWFSKISKLMEIRAPNPAQLADRLCVMERDVMLPLKTVGIIILFWSFFASPWIGTVIDILELAVETTQYFFWFYVGINVLMAGLLLGVRSLPLALIQWTVFAMSIVDGLFLASLTLVTGGNDSILFWLFLGLIIRNAVNFPPTTVQLLLNFLIILCYVLGGLAALYVANNLNEQDRDFLGLISSSETPAESMLLRVVLLLLMTFCCYIIQILLERERRATEEAHEFGVREGQLRSAGRLAAEFAHRVKNPLAIINNAVFSLQKSLKQGRGDPTNQLQIIQEEVERSDRIITQIMGYSKLTEGHVEKLNVIEELESAIAQVFPPNANYEIHLKRNYAAAFPPLLMQRQHFSEILINILQNAREAMHEKGNISITAECDSEYSIKITIDDDGPGISPDRLNQIFEAYYTSKEKGTGLGLAIAKQHAELYSGTLRVESELGKGARFILVFPAKAMTNLVKR